MGKSRKAPPPPPAPDPGKTASAQTSQNVGTAAAQAALNYVNQRTPYGSLDYDQTGTYTFTDASGKQHTVPRYTVTERLSPGQQKLYETNLGVQQGLSELAGDRTQFLQDHFRGGVDTSTLPGRPDYGGISRPDFADADYSGINVGDVQEGLLRRVREQNAQSQTDADVRLANRGIQLGSDIYNDAQTLVSRQNDERTLSALLAANDESRARSNELRARAGFTNQALTQGLNADLTLAGAQEQSRAAALDEAFALRNQPINEITALLSGSQVRDPTFHNVNAPQLANVDYAGLVSDNYRNQIAGYQAQLENSKGGSAFGDLLGAGVTLGAAALGNPVLGPSIFGVGAGAVR